MKTPGDMVRIWQDTSLWLTTDLDDIRYVAELKRNDVGLMLECPKDAGDSTMVLCLFGDRLGYVFLVYMNKDVWEP